MDFLPRKTFRRIVARYDGDSRVRTLSRGEQCRVIAFAQLTWLESLRDLRFSIWIDGRRRYAPITMLRSDAVNPGLLGMVRVLSEDAVRRGLKEIDAEAGQVWLQRSLDYAVRPLLREPRVLNVDTTVKPLYSEQ